MKLTREEMETIITFDETNERIHVQTYNGKLKRRLTAFAKDFPDLCKIEREDECGGLFAEIEKDHFSFRTVKPISEEQKEARRRLVAEHLGKN